MTLHARMPGARLLVGLVLLACNALAQSDSPPATQARVLDAGRYLIRIEVRCAEGEVDCAQVTYRGQNKRTGAKLELTGHTVHTTCADGKTPCRFLGYRFENQGFTYFVSDSGELTVSDGDTVVVRESGSWK